MRHALRRIAGLLRRYRVDRRLPPVVVDVFKTGATLRVADWRRRRRARRSPVLGSLPGDTASTSGGDTVAGAAPPDHQVARLGDRRVVTAGPTVASAYTAGLDASTWMCDALSAGGVEAFVTGRTGGRLAFGIRIEDRPRAIELLSGAAPVGWYLDWADRNDIGTVALAEGVDTRRVRVARRWTIYASTTWGCEATGPERGVDVTFYEVGTSGQYEQVGLRDNPRFDPRCPATVETIGGRPYPGITAFPVGDGLEYLHDPVHVVVTWVDGGDPEWLSAFEHTAAQEGRVVGDSALDPARYRSRDELRYSLRSLWAHCGWVDQIWLVTSGQRPDWLMGGDGLTVVDHADIMPVAALPTFNSHAIEASLHHIDGLAEHYVYVNDDMLVARPLPPEAFFTSNGLAKVFQTEAIVPGVEDADTIAVDTGAIRGRELLRQRFGRVVTGKPYHSPYPNRRSAVEDLEADFPDIVERTRHSRFRSPADVSIAASFAQHYALATGRAVIADIGNRYVNVESDRLGIALDRIRLADDVDTYCINETADDGHMDDVRERRIAEFFEAMLPVPSPWERT